MGVVERDSGMKNGRQRKKNLPAARHRLLFFRDEIVTVSIKQETIRSLFPLARRYKFTPAQPLQTN
jgi:hypothetical protein